MKSLTVVLAVLFLSLQYKLWFAQGGVSAVGHLRKLIEAQKRENAQLEQSNAGLLAEIRDLKSAHAAIEEHARNELGMIKPDEVFYQIVER